MLGGLARDVYSQAGVGCIQGATRQPGVGVSSTSSAAWPGSQVWGDGSGLAAGGQPGLEGLGRCESEWGPSTPPVQKHLEWRPGHRRAVEGP